MSRVPGNRLPLGHELVDGILHEDRFGPRPPKIRQQQPHPRLPTLQADQPAAAALRELPTPPSPTEQVAVPHGLPQLQAFTTLSHYSWKLWAALMVFTVVCGLVFHHRGMLSGPSAPTISFSQLETATEHMRAAKSHIWSVHNAPLATVVHASLDEAIICIADAKPHAAILSRELSNLAPQLDRLAEGHKTLPCSMIHPIRQRLSRASDACVAISRAIGCSLASAEAARSDLRMAVKVCDQQRSDLLAETLWGIVTRWLPSSTMKDNQGLTEALAATRQSLITTEISTNNAAGFLGSELREWNGTCKRLDSLSSDAGEWSNPSDMYAQACLDAPTLVAVRDQVAGIRTKVMKDE